MTRGMLIDGHGAPCEPDSTAAVFCLRLANDRSCVGVGRGAPHVQEAILEVYVVPLEGYQLALAHAGVEGKHVEGFEPVASRGFK